MDPCMPPADVLRGRRKRVDAVRRKGEMTAAERIDEVRTLERRGRLVGWVVGVEEGTTREQTYGLRYGGLEEAAILRVRAAMGG
jgi:hypothetical protein